MLDNLYNLKAIAHAKKRERKRLKKLRESGNVPYKMAMGKEFYLTREWRDLRWEVLSKSDGRCVMCGASRKTGAIMHVDHILPRSKFPAHELREDNLQVLCEDCNLGKSNKVPKQKSRHSA